MKISLKIFLIALFFIAAGNCMAQLAPFQNEAQEVNVKKTDAAGDVKDENENENASSINRKPDAGADNKSGSVKQVKSARPDMSKSHGARPPDIVRPSGSGIPRGVGRPAGAGRHGKR